jgi:hypothetical protein
MNNLVIVLPAIATVLFCLARICENYYTETDNQYDARIIFRDAILVFIVTLISNYIYGHCRVYLENFVNVITDSKVLPILGTLFPGLLRF